MYTRTPRSGGSRRGLSGLRIVRRRGSALGDDLTPPNIVFGPNPDTQEALRQAVISSVNAQVAADNATLIGPPLSAQVGYWLQSSIMGNNPVTEKPKTLFGQVIPNWVPIGAGVLIVGAALIAAGGKR